VFFLNVYARRNIQKCLENVESIPLSPYPVLNGTARTSIRRIKKLFNEGMGRNPAFMTDYFDNLPVLPVLEKRLKKLFVHDMPEVIGYIEWANDTVNRIKPSAIVLMEDVSPVKRAICRAFKDRNIPAIVIQHGILSEDMSGFHVMPKEADVQAVWGDASRRWQIERGAQPHTQVVTGNPRFDDFTRTSSYDCQEIVNRFGIDPDKKKILLATEYFSGISSRWTVETEEQLIRQSLRALKKIPQAQVIVKLHPSYQKKYEYIVSTIAREEQIDIKIVKEGLRELIHVSEVVVIRTSTVGLEAILLKKPLIVTNFDDRIDAGYISSGAAIIVHSQDALYLAVNGLLYGEQDRYADADTKEKFILDNAYYQDGKASERVADLIIKMTESEKL
jgi:CDP-glycerol glycerophosphotransferase (TagB/SpsB family)